MGNGFPEPPSFHTERLRDAPLSHLYDVITDGYGVMYSYADRVQPADRWAIAAYISRSNVRRARRWTPSTRISARRSMRPIRAGARDVRAATLVAVVGLTACALGAGVDGTLMAHAWLAGLTWGLMGVGALALLTWGLTGGGWGLLGAPVWRALAATLPLLIVALAVLLGVARDALFPWTAPVESLPEWYGWCYI